MFDLSTPDKITRLTTRYGDEWTPMPGTLTVNKTVLRFRVAPGDDIQVHVAEIASVVSDSE